MFHEQHSMENENLLKEFLISSQQTLLERLFVIEEKVERLTCRCRNLENKLKSAINRELIATVAIPLDETSRSEHSEDSPFIKHDRTGKKSNSEIFASNAEAYPDGSWLGNSDCASSRVRCDISPEDLSFLNSNCTTPEKMALTLLDYLFDRETQACSNISGTGKHGKLRLDPLKIFGIHCHLSHMFGIMEEHWQRIKRNLDSKCRTAFRRKRKGMSLAIKSAHKRVASSSPENSKTQTNVENTVVTALNSESSDVSLANEQIPPSDSFTSLLHAEQFPIDYVMSNVIHTETGSINIITNKNAIVIRQCNTVS